MLHNHRPQESGHDARATKQLFLPGAIAVATTVQPVTIICGALPSHLPILTKSDGSPTSRLLKKEHSAAPSCNPSSSQQLNSILLDAF